MYTEIKGKVVRAERIQRKKIFSLIGTVVDGQRLLGTCTINALNMMDVLIVGDSFEIKGNIEEYGFAKKRLDANRFHVNKKMELTILEIHYLKINNKEEWNEARYQKELADRIEAKSHKEIPTTEENPEYSNQ